MADQDRKTTSGISIKPVYASADLQPRPDMSLPGEYPYTRGIREDGYRSRLWTMREYAGFGTVEETNKWYKYLYAEGNTGFSVAFHLPTQMGYDSDHFLALGEVGRCGVAIDSLQDMEALWDGLPLKDVSVSMTINATASVILAMYIAAAEKQGAKQEELSGTTQNDILKEYLARNTYIFPLEPSLRLVTDLCSYCADKMPRWNSISICSYHMREAGATAVQEAAFCLADGVSYVQSMLDRGMAVDFFSPRFTFMLACANNFFEEVAKFRAMRRIWARIMKERFGARDPRSTMFRFHVQNDGFTMTAQQPLNNIARVALEALSCVLGGCQSLATTSYDEALCLPTEESVRVALRTQQIIACETGVPDTGDPLGGSYYVEWLTDRLEDGVWKYIRNIDDMGGAIEAIKSGYMQREITESSYQYQKEVDSGQRTVVGVNKFVIDEKPVLKIFKVDESSKLKQMEKLKKLKSERDNRKVTQALENLSRAAKTEENLMPALIEAARAYATVGEISDTLRKVFGEFKVLSMV